jgi:hypothetical protein
MTNELTFGDSLRELAIATNATACRQWCEDKKEKMLAIARNGGCSLNMDDVPQQYINNPEYNEIIRSWAEVNGLVVEFCSADQRDNSNGSIEFSWNQK